MENSHPKSALTQKEKKNLRGRAQQIKASILVGKSGLTESVIEEVKTAFAKDPLVKIRLNGDRKQVAESVAQIESATRSVCVAKVGFTATFYKELRNEKERS